MVPYIFATVAMVLWSRSSDKKNERRLHSAIPLSVAAIGMLSAGMIVNPFISVAMISLTLGGLYAFKSQFWALSTLFLDRSTAAASIAIINSIGNLGGFVGPCVIGDIKGAGNSASKDLLFLAGLLVASFLMTIFIRFNKTQQTVITA